MPADPDPGPDPDPELVATISRALHDAADPERAPRMQAYMKSTMPYLGVPLPTVRAVVRDATRRHPPSDLDRLGATARALWRDATHREQRYAATALTGLPIAEGEPALLPLYEEMIVTGAWWDHVDGLQPRVRVLLFAHPTSMRAVLLDWSTADDRWLRRSSVIAQLGAGTRTDHDLLSAVIDANAEHPDFFVRKAIGWALRDHARTDPDWVRTFVAARDDRLSPLSRREALRRLA